jgi:hypothetical protein
MTPFGDTKFHSGVSSKKTQKETSDRKEGEEAPVESQKKEKNLQFHGEGKIRSNSLFVATAAAAQEPSLERFLARSLARALSLLRPRSATAPPSCWDPASTYYYVDAIEPSDRSHPLHRTVEDDGMMRSVLYKTYRIIQIHTVFYGALAVYGS